MNRKQKPKRRRSATVGEVNDAATVALGRSSGRDDHQGSTDVGNAFAGESSKPIGARPRSETTGHHDPGSEANETLDGLTSLEEATRRAAENVPIGVPEEEIEDVPVFDRADTLPKV